MGSEGQEWLSLGNILSSISVLAGIDNFNFHIYNVFRSFNLKKETNRTNR